MLCSPLALTNDLRKLTDEDRRIILNKEIIAINQDKLGKAATRVVNEKDYQVFVRPLSGNRHAVAVMNTADKAQKLSVIFKNIGLDGKYKMRDVWQHKDIAKRANKWSGNVDAHETKVWVLE